MEKQIVKKVRDSVPLIHCITNYVTVLDVANMLLAAGGSPIMADGLHEVEDITSICRGLVINLGTLNERTVDSMAAAGSRAAKLGHPIVLDPVGAGASKFRTDTSRRLVSELPCTVIRGNVSEIKAIAGDVGSDGQSGNTQGVDADWRDAVTEENLDQMCRFVKSYSKRTHAVIAMTGAIDLVADDQRVFIIRNGHPMMAKITGTGCMLDAVLAAYICANPDNVLEAAAAAVAAEGLCGELAYANVKAEGSGLGSFRMHLIDGMSKLDDDRLLGGMRIEIR